MIENDVNISFDNYVEKFLEFYNKHFPLRKHTFKEKHKDKTYITQAIKNSIKHRNKLQKLYAKWPITYGAVFKRYRNMLTSIIRTAKENHYKCQLKENEGNAKKTWGIVSSLLGKSNSALPNCMSFENNMHSNNQDIADSFNNYFCNIASTLAKNIRQSNVPYDYYLPERARCSFFLRPTTPLEVKSIIKNLKLAAAGFDDIHIKVIKACSDEISQFLVYIINRSFNEGCFPKHLQIARVIPLHKKGDKLIHSNYRPVSILPSLSKIFEKAVAIRLTDYLSKHSFLSNDQFGFRPNYSTDLALHYFCQNIHNALDNRKFQISVFCDLSKAFDTISHNFVRKVKQIWRMIGFKVI